MGKPAATQTYFGEYDIQNPVQRLLGIIRHSERILCDILIMYMPFGLFRSKGKLGIDIGTSAIKIIELKKESGRFVLKNYGLFEFKNSDGASAAVESKQVQSILKLPDGEIIWGIKEILRKAKIKTTSVVASIPSFSTFATVIEMPYLSEQDLAKSLPFEARKY